MAEGSTSSSEDNSFFKVLMSGYMKNLSIPKAFVPKLSGAKQGKAILTTCRGRSWGVRVGPHGNEPMCFKQGWDVFMKDHRLQLGDFLVFEHKGELKFDVLIFDSTACEREYPDIEVKKEVDEQEVNANHGQDAGNHHLHEQEQEDDDEEEDVYDEFVCAPAQLKRANGKPRGSSRISMRREVIPGATEAANAYNPKSPYFKATIVASNLKKSVQYMNIPSDFAKVIEEANPTCNSVTIRDPREGKVWFMKRTCRILNWRGKKQKRMTIETGWLQFTVDMKLKVGDTCVFELDMEAKENGIMSSKNDA